MSTATAHLENELRVYKGLVEVSARINGVTEADQLLPALLDVAQRVFNVEAASIFLVTETGDMRLAASQGGMAKGSKSIIVPRGRGISGWVLDHGKPLLVADAYQDDRFFPEIDRLTGFQTRSILCVPLVRDGKEVGVLQVLNPRDRQSFREEDIEPFLAYATLAATAIDKMRSLERQREEQRVAQELSIAREIQRSFLPQKLPERREITVAATYRPALNVGGDFFDVVEVGPDELYFVIGDVAGKGIPAALLMAQALSTLRLIIRPGIAPDVALHKWNGMLTGHTIRGMFITALVGRIAISQCRVECASAGHCPPLHIGKTGETSDFDIPGAPPLGILHNLPAQALATRTLAAGEWLVFFTDGLPESFNPEGVPLDRVGIASLLRTKFDHAQEAIEALNVGELNHRRDADPHDDLTALVLGFR